MLKKRVLLGLGVFILLWHLYVLVPVWANFTPRVGQIKIMDRHEQLIAQVPFPDGFQIELATDEALPDRLKEAFLTVEDERFYQHWGVDLVAKLRAFRDNLSSGQVVSGGSTITEQLIKNRYYPHATRSYLQKAREATMALYVSLLRNKEEVLRDYLCSISFGHRNVGIKAAMKTYFDKSHLETLSDAELVSLLAIMRSPGVLNTEEKYFQDRWRRIAEQLGFVDITPPELDLKPFVAIDRFPHITATIKALVDSYEDSQIVVMSTVDSTLQEQSRELVNLSLNRLAEKNVSNGAVYVLQPASGEILVWQGSKNFHDDSTDGQVNVITRRRQQGSALKPFVYLAAFLQGAHPDQLIVDLEKDFQTDQQDEIYRPLNYGLREGGVMPLKMALANSFNIASVRLLEHLGLQEVYHFMSSLGIDFDHPASHYGASLALGSPDLTMESVAHAYARLAAPESLRRPHLIRSVNEKAWKTKELPDSQLDSTALYHLWTTLSHPLHRRRSFGVNSVLNTTIPFAVKTGTTKNFHDNWTYGYHPDLLVATWVGNNDNSPMIDVDGITGAGPIWNRVVEAATELGYVSDREPHRSEELIEQSKCLNQDCTRSELIFAQEGRSWLSDMEAGRFCLEDFFISDIDPAEIAKVAKLFDFKDFSIEWCNKKANDTEQLQDSGPPPLEILKPSPGEVFYLRSDIPLELQKIILKANQEVQWLINDERVGSGEFLFVQLEEGQHRIQAKSSQGEETRDISIKTDAPDNR